MRPPPVSEFPSPNRTASSDPGTFIIHTYHDIWKSYPSLLTQVARYSLNMNDNSLLLHGSKRLCHLCELCSTETEAQRAGFGQLIIVDAIVSTETKVSSDLLAAVGSNK